MRVSPVLLQVNTDLSSIEPEGEQDLILLTDAYAHAAAAANTVRGYNADWRGFTAWCAIRRRTPLPATGETIAYYVSVMAASGHKPASIDRARAAIRKAHLLAGMPDPTHTAEVETTLSGIRRTHGTSQTQKAPLLTDDLSRIISRLTDTLRDRRDRALLLVGFASALRRSALVALTVEEVTFTADGMTLFIPRDKTDQRAAGRDLGICRGQRLDTCPVNALRQWLQSANITTGPLFRAISKSGIIRTDALTQQSVAEIVKRHAAAVGLDPAHFAGHSLRAGLVTSATKAGAADIDIMRHTAHRDRRTLDKYIRKAKLFEDNVSGMVGL